MAEPDDSQDGARRKGRPGPKPRSPAQAMMAPGGRGGSVAGQKVSLDAAYLQQAEADLHGADLTGSNFTGAKLDDRLDGREVRMRNTLLDYADLSTADMRRADLSYARGWDMKARGARFDKAALYKTDLRGADLIGANLSGCDLTDADLRGADLTGANLDGANLTRTKLDGAVFDKASLIGAKLVDIDAKRIGFFKADLRNATISCCTLEDCGFEEAEFAGANARLSNFVSCGFDRASLTSGGIGFSSIASTWHACSYDGIPKEIVAEHPAMSIDKKMNSAAKLGARAVAGGAIAGAAAALSWMGLPGLHEAFVHDEALRLTATGIIGAIAIPVAAMAGDAVVEAGRDALREGGVVLYGNFRKAVSSQLAGAVDAVVSFPRRMAVFMGCGEDKRAMENAMQAVRPRGGIWGRWSAFATELGHVILCDREHFMAAMGLIQDAAAGRADVAKATGRAVVIVHGKEGAEKKKSPDACILRPDGTIGFVWTKDGKAIREEIYKDKELLRGRMWDGDVEVPLGPGSNPEPSFAQAFGRFLWADEKDGKVEEPASRVELLRDGEIEVTVCFDKAGRTTAVIPTAKSEGRNGANPAGTAVFDGGRTLHDLRFDAARLWEEGECKMVAAYNSRGKITEMVDHETGERTPLDQAAPAWSDAAQLRRNLHIGLPEARREGMRARALRSLGEKMGFSTPKRSPTRADLDPQL